MTSNTVVIDLMNKCLIDMSPDFSCISILKIVIAFVLSVLLMLFLVIINNITSQSVQKLPNKTHTGWGNEINKFALAKTSESQGGKNEF